MSSSWHQLNTCHTWNPGACVIFSKDVRSRKVSNPQDRMLNVHIAFTIGWRLSSSAASEFKSDWKLLTIDLTSSRLWEISWSDASCNIETHYNDVIMGAMASQITSLNIIYATVYSGPDQRIYQSSASLAICARNSPVTGEFPAQMASNAENVSIWWRHHELFLLLVWLVYLYHRVHVFHIIRLSNGFNFFRNEHSSFYKYFVNKLACTLASQQKLERENYKWLRIHIDDISSSDMVSTLRRKTLTMMTSSNGSIFRVTGPLCGEFTGDRWISLTKASDAELWCVLWSVPE